MTLAVMPLLHLQLCCLRRNSRNWASAVRSTLVMQSLPWLTNGWTPRATKPPVCRLHEGARAIVAVLPQTQLEQLDLSCTDVCPGDGVGVARQTLAHARVGCMFVN